MAGIPSQRFATSLFAVVLASASGCGLSEYESKMQEEQNRVDRFDEESRLLKAPLDVSAPRNEQRDAINVFVRPPRGTSTLLSDRKEEQRWLGLLYWYRGGSDLWVDVYVGWGAADKDLKVELLKSLGVTSQPQVKTLITTPSPGLPAVELDYFFIEGSNAKTYHVYIEPRRKVAVMYVVARDRHHKDANDAIRASINTLALGPDVTRARKAYDDVKAAASRKP